jgi:hypothetical protein
LTETRVARWFVFKPKILEGLAMEDAGMFYGHLVHFTVFCYILWTFGIVRCNLVYFFRFGNLRQRKIWQPRWRPTFAKEFLHSRGNGVDDRWQWRSDRADLRRSSF